jgi:beta-barrel assembly-enhancing protease
VVKNLVLILTMLCLGGTAYAQPRPLPDFGSPADATLSKTREAQIGRSILHQLRAAGVVSEDPHLNEYIQSLGSRIAANASNGGEHSFTFFIVDEPSINAFALPGGYIGIHTGLIAASDTESELAGVLAHEVAHVTQRHIARSIHDSQRTGIATMAAMIASILLGVATDMPADAVQGLALGAQGAMMQRQINFTRSNEFEADRVGMELLAASGFDPNGMATFFEKLAARYGTSTQYVPELLRTHPVTTDRIAEARSRARLMPSVTAENSISYGLAKARLQATTARTSEAALATFRGVAPDDYSAADRYGMALALMRSSRHDEAEPLLRRLAEEFPAVIWYRTGHAEALLAMRRDEDAMRVYEDGMGLFPRNVPLTISYAESLINSGDPARAHRILLDLLNNIGRPPTPEQIRLIARAANAEGDVANAHYYMGEYYVSTGNLPLAISQLRMALEVPGVHAVDRARFDARIEELREHLPEDDRRRSGSRQSRPTGLQ